MERKLLFFDSWMEILSGLLVLGGLYIVSLSNYLLFHSLAELFSVVVAFAAFVLVASAQSRIQNPYIMVLGVLFLCVGFIDLLHTLAYNGMGVFKAQNSNFPTQLWIAARYIEALAFIGAAVFHRARLNFTVLFWSMAFFSGIMVALIMTGHFPVCFVEGQGLTPFKIVSEYVICSLMLIAALLLWRLRPDLGELELRLVSAGIAAGIVAELAFTFYVSVYGLSNLVGHLFKIISFYFIYKAIVETGYARPQELVFRKLAESEANLSQAQRLVRMGSWEAHLPTGRTTWSEQLFRMLGYGPENEPQPSRQLLKRHVHPDDWDTFYQAVIAAATAGQAIEMELRYVPQGGGVRHVQIIGQVEKNLKGDPLRAFGVVHDITLRKQAQQLREDVENITRHDLKTPLNGIIYLAQFMEDTALDDEQREFVDRIRENGYKMLGMINQSLDMYRLERGDYKLEARTIDLVPVLVRVVDDLRELAAQGRITVEMGFEKRNRFELRGDELLCYMLFANLVRNALEAAPKGSVVRIDRAPHFSHRVAIHNQGVVPAQVRGRFFDKDATFGKRFGTGLGTYSAKLIAEVHGGRIGFTTSEEKGTTVWVEFSG